MKLFSLAALTLLGATSFAEGKKEMPRNPANASDKNTVVLKSVRIVQAYCVSGKDSNDDTASLDNTGDFQLVSVIRHDNGSFDQYSKCAFYFARSPR